MPFFSVEAINALDNRVKPRFYPRYQRHEGVGLEFKFDLKKALGLKKETIISKPRPPELSKNTKMVYDYIKVEPGQVKIVEKTPNMMVIKRHDGYFWFQDNDNSGWMEWDDWYTWKQMFVNKKYEEAQRLKVGFRAKADLLITGTNQQQVKDAEKDAYTVQWELQKKQARSKGISALGQKTEDFLKKNGGKLMMAVGTVATVIPVVGWIAGPALAIGGKVLDSHQTAQLQAKVAARRQKELEALRVQYESGQITSEEYQNRAQGICADEVAKIMAEEQTVQQDQMKIKRIETAASLNLTPERAQTYIEQRPIYAKEQKQQFPTKEVAIGGGIAVAGLALALTLAVVMSRR